MPEPLRWGDSIRDADRLVSRAIEEAREQGYRQGHAAGFRAGVEEGHREGLYNALALLRRAAWSRPFRWAHLKPNDAVEAACKWFLSGMAEPTKPNPITAAQLPAEDRA